MDEANLITKILSGKPAEGIKDITEQIDQNLGPYKKKFDYQRFVKLMLDEEFKIKVLRNIIGSKYKKLKQSQGTTSPVELPVFIYKKKIPALGRYFVFYWKDEDDYDYFLLPKTLTTDTEDVENIFEREAIDKELIDMDNYLLWFEFVFVPSNIDKYPSLKIKTTIPPNQEITSQQVFNNLFYYKNLLLMNNNVDEWNEFLKNPILLEYLEKLKGTNTDPTGQYKQIKKYINNVIKFYKMLHGIDISITGGEKNTFEELRRVDSIVVPRLHLDSLKFYGKLEEPNKKKIERNMSQSEKFKNVSQIDINSSLQNFSTNETLNKSKINLFVTNKTYQPNLLSLGLNSYGGDLNSIIKKCISEINENFIKMKNTSGIDLDALSQFVRIINSVKDEMIETGKFGLYKKYFQTGISGGYFQKGGQIKLEDYKKLKNKIKKNFVDVLIDLSVIEYNKKAIDKIEFLNEISAKKIIFDKIFMNDGEIINNMFSSSYEKKKFTNDFFKDITVANLSININNLRTLRNKVVLEPIYEELLSEMNSILNSKTNIIEIYKNFNDKKNIESTGKINKEGFKGLSNLLSARKSGPQQSPTKPILGQPRLLQPNTISPLPKSPPSQPLPKITVSSSLSSILSKLSSTQNETSKIINNINKLYVLIYLKNKFSLINNIYSMIYDNLKVNPLRYSIDDKIYNGIDLLEKYKESYENLFLYENMSDFENEFNYLKEKQFFQKLNNRDNNLYLLFLKLNNLIKNCSTNDMKLLTPDKFSENIQNIIRSLLSYKERINISKIEDKELVQLISETEKSNISESKQLVLSESDKIKYMINKINKINYYLFGLINYFRRSTENIYTENDIESSLIELSYVYYELVFNKNIIKWNSFINGKYQNIYNELKIIRIEFADVFEECIEQMHYLYHLIYNLSYKKPYQIVNPNSPNNPSSKKDGFIIISVSENNEINKSMTNKALNAFYYLTSKIWSSNDKNIINETIIKGYQNDLENEIEFYNNLSTIFGFYEIEGREVESIELLIFYEIMVEWNELKNKIADKRIQFKNESKKNIEGNMFIVNVLNKFMELFFYQNISNWNNLLTSKEMNIFIDLLYNKYTDLYMVFVNIIRKMYTFFRLIFRIGDAKKNKETYFVKNLSSKYQGILSIYTFNTSLSEYLPQMFKSKQKYNLYFNEMLFCAYSLLFGKNPNKVLLNTSAGIIQCPNTFDEMIDGFNLNMNALLEKMRTKTIVGGAGPGLGLASMVIPHVIKFGKNKIRNIGREKIKSLTKQKLGNNKKEIKVNKQNTKMKTKVLPESEIKNIFSQTLPVSENKKANYGKKLLIEYNDVVEKLNVSKEQNKIRQSAKIIKNKEKPKIIKRKEEYEKLKKHQKPEVLVPERSEQVSNGNQVEEHKDLTENEKEAKKRSMTLEQYMNIKSTIKLIKGNPFASLKKNN